MKVLHIKQETDSLHIDKLIKEGKDIFILIYMDGCGPCEATYPEWVKIEGALEHVYKNNDNLVIIDVNKNFMHNIKSVGDIEGFPTLKYINKEGQIESYEDSNISNKGRDIDSFVSWIDSKINTVVVSDSVDDVYARIQHEKQKQYTNVKSKSRKSRKRRKSRKSRKSHKSHKSHKSRKSRKRMRA